MNFKYVMALVLVLAVVAMAARPDKAARKAAKKAARKAKQEGKANDQFAHCKPFTYSYSPCTEGKMDMNKTSTKEGCENIPGVKIDCVETIRRPMKNEDLKCVKVLTTDRTACGAGDVNAVFTKTKEWLDCTKNGEPLNKSKTFTFSCETGRRDKSGKGRKGGKGKKKNKDQGQTQ